MSLPLHSLQAQVPKQRPKRWKDLGYPIFAHFTASDNELFLLRRFNTLNARIILSMQDELCQLEERLSGIDDRYRCGAEDINNGSFRRETQSDRQELVRTIKEKLREYNEFVTLHSELRSRPAVKQRQINNIENWHYKNQGAILKEETTYIRKTEDLMTIVPVTKTPLRQALELTKWFNTSSWFRHHPPPNPSYDPETIFYHSDLKMQIFDTTIVLTIGSAMLLLPLWILNSIESAKATLGVASAFILLFLALIQVVTTAKPYETLAAAAAYSAVLTVFIQTTASTSSN